MEEDIRIVQEHYDKDAQMEWDRLGNHPFEFLITTRMIDRYIKPGDKILDIGGGPGRYSVYYAQKGCEVTLFDLSTGNVKFALAKAEEASVSIKAVAGDAREVDSLLDEKFDHIFVMGPMYHLLKEQDRVNALNAALSLLKEGGILYVSFIFMFSGLIYGMKYFPELVLDEASQVFVDAVLQDQSYGGDAFTKAFFISKKDILPFMEKFPLEKMHLFGQESILSPCEPNILSQTQEVIGRWVDIAEKLCERDDLLSYAEHVMYIGRKR